MIQAMPDFVDHDAETKLQQKIAADVQPSVEKSSEPSVAGTPAESDDAAALDTDDVVKVRIASDADVNYVRVAGVKLEPGQDAEVTRATALLLASHDKVEVVE